MKTFELLSVPLLLLLFISCTKEEEEQYLTRVSGQVLEAGTLHPVKTDSLSILIIDGYPCGLPCFSTGAEAIAKVEVENGRYDYSFEADDGGYHWMSIEDERTGYAANVPGFEIFPGVEQVRDFILYRTTDLIFTFHDKGIYPDKQEVRVGGTDQHVLPHRRFYPDSVAAPYSVSLPVIAGQVYEVEAIITYATNKYRTLEFTLEIPYHDTLEIDIDM